MYYIQITTESSTHAVFIRILIGTELQLCCIYTVFFLPLFPINPIICWLGYNFMGFTILLVMVNVMLAAGYLSCYYYAGYTPVPIIFFKGSNQVNIIINCILVYLENIAWQILFIYFNAGPWTLLYILWGYSDREFYLRIQQQCPNWERSTFWLKAQIFIHCFTLPNVFFSPSHATCTCVYSYMNSLVSILCHVDFRLNFI